MCPLNLYIIKDLSIMWIRVDLAEILAVHIPLDNLNIKDHNTLFYWLASMQKFQKYLPFMEMILI